MLHAHVAPVKNIKNVAENPIKCPPTCLLNCFNTAES